jgi:N-acetylmuramoyl-L-alanine amidase
MRKVNKVIIHCSATGPEHDIDAKVVDGWHKKRGWKGIGYHFFIKRDGAIEFGRDINEVGAHTKGQNQNSIGVCYAGGVKQEDPKTPEDNRTDEQKASLEMLSLALKCIFPDVTFHGHREYAPKACPSFDVSQENYGFESERSPEHLIREIKKKIK